MTKIKVVYGIAGVIEVEWETETTEKNTVEDIKEAGFKEVLAFLKENGGLSNLLPDEDFDDWGDSTREAKRRFSFHYEEV